MAREAIKGTVLVMVSSVTFYFPAAMIVLDFDVKYLLTNISIVMDSICLFLVFNEQTFLYKNMCGCLCDKCCVGYAYRTRYESIQMSDEESNVV